MTILTLTLFVAAFAGTMQVMRTIPSPEAQARRVMVARATAAVNDAVDALRALGDAIDDAAGKAGRLYLALLALGDAASTLERAERQRG